MTRSSSRGALPVVVAVLCILGVGMAAATLSTADPIGATDDDQIFVPDTPGGIDADIDQNTSGDVDDGPTGGADANRMEMTTCIEALDSTVGTFGVVLAFVAVVGLIYYRFNFATSLLASWTLLPPVMLVYFLVTDCGGSGGGVPNLAGGGGSDAYGDAIAPISNVPPWTLGVLIGAVFVGAAVLLYRSTGEDEFVVPGDEDGGDTDPDVDQFAEAAGRAADRIEKHNADVDNTVYSAWLEMTGLLNVERPETYSAGEFATAAIDVGLGETDVSELTELFNEVRYGGKDAESREDRAVTVLRNIESQYGTEEPPAESTSGADSSARAGDDPAEEGDR